MHLRSLITLSTAVLLAVGLSPSDARAQQGSIELRTIAQKELRVVGPSGETEVKLVPAGKVIPGDRVVYTIVAANVSSEQVDRVVITDPIPEHMTYVDGTAESDVGSVLFSVDGGMKFDLPERLEVVGEDGAPRPAEPSDFTHVRFVFDRPMQPASEQSVRFVAQLD